MQTQPYAFSYRPIDGTSYNIYEGKVKLFEDPLEPGNYPLFANCTIKEPLPDKKGLTISFNTETDSWEYIENHIGEEGYIDDDKPYVISQYGPRPTGFRKELSTQKKTELRKDEVESIIKMILNRTDFLLIPDYPIGVEQKDQIVAFRNIVRNLDKDENFPFYNQDIPIPEWPLKGLKSCPYSDLLPLIKKQS